ncbi:MAG TPA: hypothetical protein VFR37_05420 [Longimicrobium sp.]|nr:hypothetical protein [Longimicrobium sp.]
MIHTPDARRWVLAREGSARRLAAAGGAGGPRRAERVLRRLDRETSRTSHRRLIELRAADDLLDAAAAGCFVDPVGATDLVRWNHLRRLAGETEQELARGPAAFGSLRVAAEAPALWSELAEPRHQHVPAWTRFENAVRVWADVQNGSPWIPPDRYPPPAEPPAAHPARRPETERPPAPQAAPTTPASPRPPTPRTRLQDRGPAR